MQPSILLCDDHALLLEALVGILPAHGFNGVKAVPSTRGALSLLRERPFQVCLVNITFPDENGLVALREFRRLRPEMKVLIPSATRERRVIADALAAGALGFCSKDAEMATILAAIERVASGSGRRGRVANPGRCQRRTELDGLADFLTERDKEVLARRGKAPKHWRKEWESRRAPHAVISRTFSQNWALIAVGGGSRRHQGRRATADLVAATTLTVPVAPMQRPSRWGV